MRLGNQAIGSARNETLSPKKRAPRGMGRPRIQALRAAHKPGTIHCRQAAGTTNRAGSYVARSHGPGQPGEAINASQSACNFVRWPSIPCANRVTAHRVVPNRWPKPLLRLSFGFISSPRLAPFTSLSCPWEFWNYQTFSRVTRGLRAQPEQKRQETLKPSGSNSFVMDEDR